MAFAEGPAGRIEIRVDPVEGSDTAAVLCHPHPRYGGSMHDAVLATATHVFRRAGVGCVRFNFRGVGASEGEFDGGQGEVDDVVAVVEHVRAELTPASIILVGYSFGALMALGAVTRPELADAAIARLVLIAPPLGPDAPVAPGGIEISVIHGTEDGFVSADAVDAFAAANPATPVERVSGADHFFSGEHSELADRLRSAVS